MKLGNFKGCSAKDVGTATKIVCGGKSQLVDYLEGIGQAFDPLPIAYGQTYVDVDAMAFAVDSYILSCDLALARPEVAKLLNSTLRHSNSMTIVDGKTGRVSEKA